jgi:hypothetical protein
MRSHRISYLKTAVAALGASVVSFFLAACALGGRVPLTDLTLPGPRLLLWTSAAALIALGLVSLLVATGGLLALHGDANEGHGPARSGPR